MPQFSVKYVDDRGGAREDFVTANSERAARRQFEASGLHVQVVKETGKAGGKASGTTARRLDLGQFVVFNEQFLALIRAGMPIPQSLELLAGNVRSKALAARIAAVRDQVKVGVPLSEAFAEDGDFPAIYVTSLLAGERSGALDSVVERYINYQKMVLAIRKKLLVSLIYPAVLVALVAVLVVFLVTYVVPEFSQLYVTMDAELPASTQLLVALGGASRDHAIPLLVGLVAIAGAVFWLLRSGSATNSLERMTLRAPVLGRLWIRYQVAQLSRLLSTLLAGGIPLCVPLRQPANPWARASCAAPWPRYDTECARASHSPRACWRPESSLPWQSKWCAWARAPAPSRRCSRPLRSSSTRRSRPRQRRC